MSKEFGGGQSRVVVETNTIQNNRRRRHVGTGRSTDHRDSSLVRDGDSAGGSAEAALRDVRGKHADALASEFKVSIGVRVGLRPDQQGDIFRRLGEIYARFLLAALVEVRSAGGILRLRSGGALGDVTQCAFHEGLDGRHGGVVLRVHGDVIRDPSEVIGEFHAFRGEGLAVNEINQAVAVMQVVDEAEAALRIAHRNQVFKEADLHVGSFEEHAWVPVEFRAGFHKECIEFWSLLFDSYREPEVSGADADPDDVADGIFVVLRSADV